MTRPPHLFLDQYGNHWRATGARDLQRQIGGRRSAMFLDFRDGTTYRVGYVIGQHWCSEFAPVREPVR